MSYDPLDAGTGSGSATTVRNSGGGLATNSGDPGPASSHYDLSTQSSGIQQAIQTVRRVGKRAAQSKGSSQPPVTPPRRDLVRQAVQRAKREAEAMATSAKEGNLTRVSNLAFGLRDTLQDLWQLRGEREDDWGDLLNTLQIAFGIDDYDSLTLQQCNAVRDVVFEHLSVHTVDISDIESSVLLLRKAGLDPFGWSSGNPDPIDPGIED